VLGQELELSKRLYELSSLPKGLLDRRRKKLQQTIPRPQQQRSLQKTYETSTF
jgi:hypothetical protein